MLQQGLLFFKIQCFEEQKKALPLGAALFTKSYNYKFCKFYTLLLSSCGERFLAAQDPDRDGQGLEYLFCLSCRVFCRPDEADALPAIQGRDDAQVVTAFDDADDRLPLRVVVGICENQRRLREGIKRAKHVGAGFGRGSVVHRGRMERHQ